MKKPYLVKDTTDPTTIHRISVNKPNNEYEKMMLEIVHDLTVALHKQVNKLENLNLRRNEIGHVVFNASTAFMGICIYSLTENKAQDVSIDELHERIMNLIKKYFEESKRLYD